MWYLVKSLSEKGLNKSQISRELQIDRGTVRKYLSMDENTFQTHISHVTRMPKKLKGYYTYVKELLQSHPYLSAAQVEDRLKENFTDLPEVHSKTVYNFVMSVRQEQGIKKPKAEQFRQYEQVTECDYGSEAQVDFGEHWMRSDQGMQKVYFMVMVLSRSRYKHVYFQSRPFTAKDAITAHKHSFNFIEGVPRKIIYDQDKVFVVNENLGDVVLTQAFKRYVESESFECVFCRKADPQTKGKVENVVKYVKYNFLRGRHYYSDKRLNDEVIGWLQRTANGKKHGATHKIPANEWNTEKTHLLAPCSEASFSDDPQDQLTSYNVRKDNTIAYKGNFYTVPTGTYKNQKSTVLLRVADNQLLIYDTSDKVILAQHTISIVKGRLIRKTDHLRDKTTKLKDKESQILDQLGNDQICKIFLSQIHQDKPRYYHDHLRVIKTLLEKYDEIVVVNAVHQCVKLGIHNANELKQVLSQSSIDSPVDVPRDVKPSSLPEQANIHPVKSSIETYQSIMN